MCINYMNFLLVAKSQNSQNFNFTVNFSVNRATLDNRHGIKLIETIANGSTEILNDFLFPGTAVAFNRDGDYSHWAVVSENVNGYIKVIHRSGIVQRPIDCCPFCQPEDNAENNAEQNRHLP